MNNVRNQLTGEFGTVPDTARYYKVWKLFLPQWTLFHSY